jgi:hypothetical protein
MLQEWRQRRQAAPGLSSRCLTASVKRGCRAHVVWPGSDSDSDLLDGSAAAPEHRRNPCQVQICPGYACRWLSKPAEAGGAGGWRRRICANPERIELPGAAIVWRRATDINQARLAWQRQIMRVPVIIPSNAWQSTPSGTYTMRLRRKTRSIRWPGAHSPNPCTSRNKSGPAFPGAVL